jgi:hypothetical protein
MGLKVISVIPVHAKHSLGSAATDFAAAPAEGRINTIDRCVKSANCGPAGLHDAYGKNHPAIPQML